MRCCKLTTVVLLVASVLTVGCEQPADQPDVQSVPVVEPQSERAPEGDVRLRTSYVPAYSYLPDGDRRAMLSVLLSVRNVDSAATVKLTHVDYFDTEGNRVRRYLTESVDLGPLETVEFTVETEDETGGSGANFLVYWEGPSDAHPLLTEAVMVGHMISGYVSFASRGIELDRRPSAEVLGVEAGSE
ncbi:MAG: DUF3124 domain-containing protein [Candidatus Eisenbacteria bacterium]|uniref:DUF3124 domain-containing protein n=1 Tax=Eiseniibacteriota bacterium TaxID=2212470 RepID=A0A956ND78_UNCEI|nr:DUF3124 domain-containing protein [Candidatus Eisenbacteria bacterium]MCB9466409.1 DUF3124 domain-containing protein [Candidatus Eisenbacteria bacterium]